MSKVKKEAKIDFYVTHIINEPAPLSGYAKVGFITATNESIKEKKYFLGFGTHRSFNEGFFNAKIEANSITKLPAPHKITKEKTIWIDQAFSIYIGDKTNPFTDDLKLIYNHSNSINPNSGILKDVQPKATTAKIAHTNDIISLYNKTFSKESLNEIQPSPYTIIIEHGRSIRNPILGTANRSVIDGRERKQKPVVGRLFERSASTSKKRKKVH